MDFDYSWLIGGPQGSGVDTAANIFSRVGAKLGYHVFGRENIILTSRVSTAILWLDFQIRKFVQT